MKLTSASAFGALAAAFGAIPGLTILITRLGAPPSNSALFGAITVVFGVLTLALLWAKRKWIKTHPFPGVVTCALLIATAFFAMVLYISLINYCVVASQKAEFHDLPPVYFPLVTAGEIAADIEKLGSRLALVDKYGPSAISAEIAKMPQADLRLSVTTAVLILDLQVTVSLITAAFAILAIRLETSPRESAGR